VITNPAWKGRRYAVLGLARSGRATVEALLASGADVLAWDDREDARAPFVGRTGIADPLQSDLTGYDGVVVSPGVPLNTHPIKPHADSFGVPVIGDIELFAQQRLGQDDRQVVACREVSMLVSDHQSALGIGQEVDSGAREHHGTSPAGKAVGKGYVGVDDREPVRVGMADELEVRSLAAATGAVTQAQAYH
jgi:hypothetical protein